MRKNASIQIQRWWRKMLAKNRQKAVINRMNLAAFMIQRAWRNHKDNSMGFVQLLNLIAKNRVKLEEREQFIEETIEARKQLEDGELSI